MGGDGNGQDAPGDPVDPAGGETNTGSEQGVDDAGVSNGEAGSGASSTGGGCQGGQSSLPWALGLMALSSAMLRRRREQ